MKWLFYLLTWVYCILLNTAFATILINSNIFYGKRSYFAWDDCIKEMGYTGMFTLAFSLPGLAALLVAPWLTKFVLHPGQRYAGIVACCLLGTFVGYLLVWHVLGLSPFVEASVFMIASFAAVIISLLLTRKMFLRRFMPEALRKRTLLTETMPIA